MNLSELKALVREGESERVEFKRSTGQRTSAAKTVCAMLNGLGGFVIFGVATRENLSANRFPLKRWKTFLRNSVRLSRPLSPILKR